MRVATKGVKFLTEKDIPKLFESIREVCKSGDVKLVSTTPHVARYRIDNQLHGLVYDDITKEEAEKEIFSKVEQKKE